MGDVATEYPAGHMDALSDGPVVAGVAVPQFVQPEELPRWQASVALAENAMGMPATDVTVQAAARVIFADRGQFPD